ncbi:MAG TPA: DNRLRE domain-containing protein, partial [Actinomycetota bacterium]|nr:DNRLRE domain-containing protein [Actinomycetota bacterium]
MALDAAQRSGKKVEIVSARSETQTTFANPEGTLTTELSAGPVRVRRGDGFVPIDTTLQIMDGAVVPKAAPAEVVLSNGGAEGSELVSLSSHGTRLSFKSPQALPTPVLKGDTATYPDVAVGQDLVVKATPTGFETFVVLKTRPEEPVVITIPLGLDGLVLAKDETSGELQFSNLKGEPQVSSSTPLMWSAARDPRADEPTQVRTVDTEIEKVGRDTHLVLRPNFQFLSDPSTTYPLTIDPAAELTTSLDTYVSSAAPTATFGSDPELKVGRFIADGSDTVFRSFLRFNTSAIANRTVYSAGLYLYQTGGYSCGSSSMWVDKPASFTSSTSWSNQPTVDGQHWYSGSWSGGAASCPWASGWRSLDIRNLANNWAAAGGSSGNLALLAPDETNQDHFRKFSSSNSSWPPKIAVEYDAQSQYPAPGSATAVAANGQVTISWPAAVFAPEAYGVALYRAAGPDNWVFEGISATLAPNQFSKTFTGLVNGQGYIAQVTSFGNGVWGRPVSSNIFKPAVAPSAPTNVKATPLDSAALISWDPSIAGTGAALANYVVYAYNEQNQVLNHMVVNHPSTSGTFSNLTTNNGQGLVNLQTYRFRVKAFNDSGQPSAESAQSNPVTPERPSDQVGLEDFYPYQDFALGQGTAFANMANGNLVVQDTDYNVPGQGLNMRLSRTYNSSADAAVGPFGRGWTLGVSEGEAGGGLLSASLDLKQILTLLFGGRAMVFVDEDGTRHRFLKQESGLWQSPPGVNLTLTDLLGTYTLTRPDGVVYKMTSVGSSLRLTQILDRKGNALTFAYTGDKLASITDTSGRTLTFTQPGSLITSVSFDSGNDSMRTDFGYGGAAGDRLISVTHDAGTPSSAITTDYTYSSDGLRTVKDARGNSTTFDIPAGKLAKITDRAGQPWTFGYTGGSCVPAAPATVAVCLTDPESKTSLWSTSVQGNLRSRRDAGDKDHAGADRLNTESFDWAGNRLTSHTD